MHKRLKRIICAGTAALVWTLTCVTAWAGVDTAATFQVDSNSWKNWPAGPDIQGDTAVVMELETGAVLYNKGMDAQRYPASITKIMTAMLVLENCDLNGQVTMTETGMADAYSGSSNCLPKLGEVFSVEQCLQMIMIKSANDVSTQVAEYMSGSVQGFADRMNSRAAELGCQNTHFCNASGLENNDHYTSAHDMALIMREALKYDKFREILAMQNVTIPATNMSGERYYETHVQMMVPGNPYYYGGCFGGKTGYTDISKSTLVTCAQRDGITLIGVVMGGIDSNLICDDMKAVLDYGFQNFTKTDASYGCETISGGTAMLPQNVKLESLTTKAEETEEGTLVTYELSNQVVGSAVMTDENYAVFQEKRGVKDSGNQEGEAESESSVVTVSRPTEEKQISDSDEGQGSGTKLAVYIAIAILGILILGGVVLIFLGASKKNNRRKRRR